MTNTPLHWWHLADHPTSGHVKTPDQTFVDLPSVAAAAGSEERGGERRHLGPTLGGEDQSGHGLHVDAKAVAYLHGFARPPRGESQVPSPAIAAAEPPRPGSAVSRDAIAADAASNSLDSGPVAGPGIAQGGRSATSAVTITDHDRTALFFSDIAYHGADAVSWYNQQLSSFVGSNPFLTGWTCIAQSTDFADLANADKNDSYFGVAFKNNSTGETIVANRGSLSAIDWGTTDRCILHQTTPLAPAFGDAVRFAQDVGGNIFETGHSLGGAEAQYVASQLAGVSGTTFAAPGMQWAAPGQTANVNGYSFVGELIGNLYTPVGSRQILFPDGGLTEAGNVVLSLALDDLLSALPLPFSAVPLLDPLAFLHLTSNFNEHFGLSNVGDFQSVDPNITTVNPVEGIILALGPFEPKTTLPVSVGGTATISRSFLWSTDPIYSDADLTYTVVTPPSHGTILDNGSAATRFTQADIDNNRVQYRENGDAATADSFVFTLSDPAGNHTAPETFDIAILAQAPARQAALTGSRTFDFGDLAVAHDPSQRSSTPGGFTAVMAQTTSVTRQASVVSAPAQGLILGGAALDASNFHFV